MTNIICAQFSHGQSSLIVQHFSTDFLFGFYVHVIAFIPEIVSASELCFTWDHRCFQAISEQYFWTERWVLGVIHTSRNVANTGKLATVMFYTQIGYCNVLYTNRLLLCFLPVRSHTPRETKSLSLLLIVLEFQCALVYYIQLSLIVEYI